MGTEILGAFEARLMPLETNGSLSFPLSDMI